MLVVRDYARGDAETIAPLLGEIGSGGDVAEIERRVKSIRTGSKRDRILVAVDGDEVVGILTLHFTPVIHRNTAVGRVTALVVAERARRRGIGALLMAEAERLARLARVARLELTSGHERGAAHALYRRLGFRDEGIRFAKRLDCA